MAELKTKPNNASVKKFLESVEHEQRRKDSFEILEMIQNVTKEKPKMWGDSIVGFGSYRYKYKTGREGDWFLAGFSPRKRSLTIYMMGGFKEVDDLIADLGKCKTSVGCLYINKLDDIDRAVLKKMITNSVKRIKKTYK